MSKSKQPSTAQQPITFTLNDSPLNQTHTPPLGLQKLITYLAALPDGALKDSHALHNLGYGHIKTVSHYVSEWSDTIAPFTYNGVKDGNVYKRVFGNQRTIAALREGLK